MSRPLAAVFAVLLFVPVSVADSEVLNPPAQGDPVYVIPAGICGNGVVEDGEECDPGYPDLGIEPDLGGATCGGQGFDGGGAVTCTPTCTLEFRACSCRDTAGLPATGQARCWDQEGIEIDCAGTGQDGDVRGGAPLAYTDNGDGTVTDENTGLVWEKKTRGYGIHGTNTRFTWEGCFSEFLPVLNGTCDGAGVTPCRIDEDCGSSGRCGFAGHRDWRIPNVRELQSIVNYDVPYPGPTVDPAFDNGCHPVSCSNCSCTRSSLYWTSTSSATFPGFAWSVYFNYGSVNFSQKDVNYFGYVRAVRGPDLE